MVPNQFQWFQTGSTKYRVSQDDDVTVQGVPGKNRYSTVQKFCDIPSHPVFRETSYTIVQWGPPTTTTTSGPYCIALYTIVQVQCGQKVLVHAKKLWWGHMVRPIFPLVEWDFWVVLYLVRPTCPLVAKDRTILYYTILYILYYTILYILYYTILYTILYYTTYKGPDKGLLAGKDAILNLGDRP
jgi:predicted membrane protein